MDHDADHPGRHAECRGRFGIGYLLDDLDLEKVVAGPQRAELSTSSSPGHLRDVLRSRPGGAAAFFTALEVGLRPVAALHGRHCAPVQDIV
jgi:hypothetical protein